jgi:UDP-glucose 4-epimerase
MDLAEAHLSAVEHLLAGGPTIAVNLGTGTGTSVLELIDAIEKTSALRIAVERHPPRAGDATTLVADPRRAAALLGWTARRDLTSIVDSAFQWHKRNGFHPAGRA